MTKKVYLGIFIFQIEKNKKAAEEVHIASKKDFLQNFSKSQVSSTTVPENESLIISNGNGNHNTSSSSDEAQIMKSNNSSSVSASEIRSKRHSVCTMEQQKDHAAENNEVRNLHELHSTYGTGSCAIDFTQLGHQKCFGTKQKTEISNSLSVFYLMRKHFWCPN